MVASDRVNASSDPRNLLHAFAIGAFDIPSIAIGLSHHGRVSRDGGARAYGGPSSSATIMRFIASRVPSHRYSRPSRKPKTPQARPPTIRPSGGWTIAAPALVRMINDTISKLAAPSRSIVLLTLAQMSIWPHSIVNRGTRFLAYPRIDQATRWYGDDQLETSTRIS